jgi:hypothetical protein
MWGKARSLGKWEGQPMVTVNTTGHSEITKPKFTSENIHEISFEN